jgi:sarcosine oxidase subunit alpha
VDVAVIGAGPAGLCAAAIVAKTGARVLLLDDQALPGGSLLAEPDGWARAQALVEKAQAAGARLVAGAEAMGVYAEGEPAATGDAAGLLAVATEQGILAVRARRFLYATGAYDQGMAIPEGDHPGVLAARAVGRLAFLWGIAPGRKLVLVTEGTAPESELIDRLRAGLAARGVKVETTTPESLPKLDLKDDVLALGSTPAPASELPRQHGAHVVLDLARGGFCVEADARGATGVAGIYVAGDVTGYAGPVHAAEAGARVGAALVDSLASP